MYQTGLISDSLVDAGNKNTAGSSNLLRGTMKSLFDAKTASQTLHQLVRPRNYISTFNVFEKSWLMSYRCVVTVTQLDFGPRLPLTTAAIA